VTSKTRLAVCIVNHLYLYYSLSLSLSLSAWYYECFSRIPPIPFLRSVVFLPACQLSHSCTLLKPFDGFRCLSIWQVHLWGPMTHCFRWGQEGPWPPGEGRFGGSNPQPKHAIASPMLSPGEYKRGAIPPFAKLPWSLLFFKRLCMLFASACSACSSVLYGFEPDINALIDRLID